jgi:hypothetical protein
LSSSAHVASVAASQVNGEVIGHRFQGGEGKIGKKGSGQTAAERPKVKMHRLIVWLTHLRVNLPS